MKRSFAERGLLRTLLLAPRLPLTLLRERHVAKVLSEVSAQSEFDERYGVDTDGAVGGKGDSRSRTFLSDLEIPSANWIFGVDYSPIPPEQFKRIFASLRLNLQEYVFIDFGSGKGRALLLASDLPFKKIIGVEFSPELHAVAQSNIKKYSSPTQLCNSLESINMDITDYQLPLEPCILYFLDPCRATIYPRILENIRKSWKAFPRNIVIVYVAPRSEAVFNSSGFLRKLTKVAEDDDNWFSVYEVIPD